MSPLVLPIFLKFIYRFGRPVGSKMVKIFKIFKNTKDLGKKFRPDFYRQPPKFIQGTIVFKLLQGASIQHFVCLSVQQKFHSSVLSHSVSKISTSDSHNGNDSFPLSARGAMAVKLSDPQFPPSSGQSTNSTIAHTFQWFPRLAGHRGITHSILFRYVT